MFRYENMEDGDRDILVKLGFTTPCQKRRELSNRRNVLVSTIDNLSYIMNNQDCHKLEIIHFIQKEYEISQKHLKELLLEISYHDEICNCFFHKI